MKLHAIYLFLILVLFVFGFALGVSVSKGIKSDNGLTLPAIKKVSQTGGTFADGWQAAKDKLIASGYIYEPEEIMNLSGSVQSVSGNKIILETNLFNPLDDEEYKTRIVSIDAETQIISQKEKTAEEQERERLVSQAEIAKLRNQIKQTEDTEEQYRLENEIMNLEFSYMNYKEEPATVSDIMPGYNINVISNEDVKNKLEFTAGTITFMIPTTVLTDPSMEMYIEDTEEYPEL